MQKLFCWTIPCLLFLCLMSVGCLSSVAGEADSREKATEVTDMEPQKPKSKILVVYYSYSRNTDTVAKRIAALTDADIYEVRTKKAYPHNPYETSAISIVERKTGRLPELIGDFPELARYDVVYIGSPIWNANLATPMESFLRQSDFTGKTVVPFSTSMGSGQSGYLNDFKKNLQNAAVIGEYLDIEFPGNGQPEAFSEDELNSKLRDWIIRSKPDE